MARRLAASEGRLLTAITPPRHQPAEGPPIAQSATPFRPHASSSRTRKIGRSRPGRARRSPPLAEDQDRAHTGLPRAERSPRDDVAAFPDPSASQRVPEEGAGLPRSLTGLRRPSTDRCSETTSTGRKGCAGRTSLRPRIAFWSRSMRSWESALEPGTGTARIPTIAFRHGSTVAHADEHTVNGEAPGCGCVCSQHAVST